MDEDRAGAGGTGSAAGARLADLGLVALGGAAGSVARFLVGEAVGPLGASSPLAGFPVGTLLVNVAGAFLLGLLVAAAERAGGQRWRSARLLLGTGALGGFTTYSLLSTEIAGLLLGGGAVVAVLYAAATLALGGAASWLGMLAGRARGAGAGAAR